MIYRAIGLMSGSSLDGLDIVFSEIEENGGKWSAQIVTAECMSYPEDWVQRLKQAPQLPALDYLLLHTAYGRYLGEQVNSFIEKHGLQYRISLIASHGHTSFHFPAQKMTAQLGDGAALAAVTGLPVVTDLRALDVALGGQGAPIVPIGEELLFPGYDYFLNLGGIANISKNSAAYIAFDVCPANAVLNKLAGEMGHAYDAEGSIAATGQIDETLLAQLNAQAYYQKPYPKSLANEFGNEQIFSIIKEKNITIPDALRTYTDHIAFQISEAIRQLNEDNEPKKILITGGGAFNTFLLKRLNALLAQQNIEAIVPDDNTVKYKEALIMALIGILRWREEDNVFASVTGASRNSVGGAMWMGQEA